MFRETRRGGFIRFGVIFDPDTPSSIPRRFLIKTNLDGHPYGTAETSLYGTIASGLDPSPLPPTFDVGYDEATGNGYLLQADLSETHGFAVTDTREPTVEGLGAIVDQIARIHAVCWDRPFIEEETYLVHRGDICDLAQMGLLKDLRRSCSRIVDDRLPRLFKIAHDDLRPEWKEICERAVTSWPDLIAPRFLQSHLTLIHADLHPWNIFVPNDDSGPPLIFDWELLCRGLGLYDVAYLIIRCRLDPPVRRAFEAELIPRYQARLSDLGVKNYTLADCRRDYRLSIIPNILPPLSWGRPLNLVSTMEAFFDWECQELSVEA